ncbi:MAG TPA: LysR family transcriptional regulator [Rhodocyclaceae bacterium]|nr:LysR family transcriptional regulator [Rhodocyclaceae bacterium]
MDRSIDLNALKIFVKTVRLNGISHAARDLGLPKSTVSLKLRQLEEQLGIRLLQRTTRRQVLTDEGRGYFEAVSRLMDDLVAANLSLASRQLLPLGTIRVTAPVDFGTARLGCLLAGFRSRYPAVQLEVELTGRRVNLVEEGFDLALRLGELEDSTFVCRKIASVGQKLVASPGYLRGHGAPSLPAELGRHVCLAHPSQLKAGGWRLRSALGLEIHPLASDFVANSFHLLRDAARQDHGITVLPDYLADEEVAAGQLVEILPDWKLDPVPLFVLYPSNKLLATRVRKLIDYLGEHLEPGQLASAVPSP